MSGSVHATSSGLVHDTVVPLRAPQMRAAATDVLRANDNGSYTVPARATYPHQWCWDSALAALGWADLEPDRAWSELEALAGGRDRDGMLPHIAFHPHVAEGLRGKLRGALDTVARRRPRYLPGPRWWGRRLGADGRRISGITQPPLASSCMRMLFEEHPDERRARALLAPLLGWHRFLLDQRDPQGLGEPVLIHPWETGRDNAAEWDAPLWAVTPELAVVQRADTDSVDAAERPTTEHYRRFLTLVRRGTGVGWNQELLAAEGPFRVLDPGFSAILARACLDLGWLAEQLGEPGVAEESRAASERVAAALRSRADGDGLIRPVDLVRGSTLEPLGAGSALALLTPDLEGKQVRAARELVQAGALASPYGVRSLDRDHPEHSSRSYWRGPAWTNVTWLSAWALERHGEGVAATELRLRMVRAIDKAGMREYFAPDTGRGLGAHDFTWTAALCLRELPSAVAERPAADGGLSSPEALSA